MGYSLGTTLQWTYSMGQGDVHSFALERREAAIASVSSETH